jgi:hypothetical protein
MAYIKLGHRDLTSEQILAKCPEVINKAGIPTRRIGGATFHTKGNKRMTKGGRPWYNEEMRIKAACVYAITGSAAKTGEILNIKPGTVRQWKMQPWWQQVIDRIRSEKDDELDVKFTGIIDKTVEQINDRLEKGDYIYDVRTGELNRKPMGGKEMAVVTSIFMDKRALLREKKHQHSEQSEVMDRLKKLAEEFSGFVKAKDVTKESLSNETVVEAVEDLHAERAGDEPSSSGDPQERV